MVHFRCAIRAAWDVRHTCAKKFSQLIAMTSNFTLSSPYYNKWIWRNAPRTLRNTLKARGLVLWRMEPPRSLKELQSIDNNETEYVPCLCWHNVPEWARGHTMFEEKPWDDSNTTAISNQLSIHFDDTSIDCQYYTPYLVIVCFVLCVALLCTLLYSCWSTKRRVRYYGVEK